MTTRNLTASWVCIIASLIAANAAFAEKPSWAGGGKQEKHHQEERHGGRDDRKHDDGHREHDDRHGSDYRSGRYFIDRHRMVVRDYYVNEYRSGHCPPGLAKKRNGCLPPGQAKRWRIGRPLPRDVIFYDLPTSVLMGMGPPPPGYRFVRVASDILMISIGTGMVMDAIHDLGGL